MLHTHSHRVTIDTSNVDRRYIVGENRMITLLERIGRLLAYRMSIAEFIGLGLILGTPYLIAGIIWSTTHTAHLHQMQGVDLVVSFLGSIVSWPVLLFSNVCMQ